MAIEDNFPVIPTPKSGDWLSEHHEEGQTVGQFERRRKPLPTPSFVSSFFLCIKENYFILSIGETSFVFNPSEISIQFGNDCFSYSKINVHRNIVIDHQV